MRHNKKCSAGTQYFLQCPFFPTISHYDFTFFIANKLSLIEWQKTRKCWRCSKDIQVALRGYRQKIHRAKKRSDLKVLLENIHKASRRQQLARRSGNVQKDPPWTLRNRTGDTESSVLQETHWTRILWIHCLLTSNLQTFWIQQMICFSRMWRMVAVAVLLTLKITHWFIYPNPWPEKGICKNQGVGEKCRRIWILQKKASKHKVKLLELSQYKVFAASITKVTIGFQNGLFQNHWPKVLNYWLQVWKTDQKNVQRQFMSFQNPGFPLAGHTQIGRGDF